MYLLYYILLIFASVFSKNINFFTIFLEYLLLLKSRNYDYLIDF